MVVINSANLLLGVVAFALLFQRTWRRRAEYPREVYLLLLVLEAFVITLLAASAELLFTRERAIHVILISTLITGVKSSLLYVLWTTRNTLFRTGTRRVVNDDEMRVNRDLEDHPHPYLQGGGLDGRTG